MEDRTGYEEADKLFYANRKLARMTLYKVFPYPKATARRKGLDLADMKQYAYTGLWKACISYDPTKGTSFRTHAINHIRWHLIEKAKREGNPLKLEANKDINFEDMPRVNSMDKTVSSLGHGGVQTQLTLHDIISDGVLLEGAAIDELFVQELLASATEEQLDIINLRLQDLSYNEIADLRYGGCTGENVRAKIRNLKAKMKKHIKETTLT